MSPTTPTIRIGLGESRPHRIMRPIGSWPGKDRRASASLISVVNGASYRVAVADSRGRAGAESPASPNMPGAAIEKIACGGRYV